MMESLNVLDHVSFDGSNPVLRTLLPGPGPRVMLLCLRAGQVLPEHATPDAITIQTLSGCATFYDGTAMLEAKSGMLIRLDARRPHKVVAQEESALLVTILAPFAEPTSLNELPLDLRDIPHGERHRLVFVHLRGLALGEAFTIVNDHDPHPLRKQISGRFPGETAWDYLERGPKVFRVRISRVGLPANVRNEANQEASA
jgi:uncharacterized protein (DUF2249 family)/quercetin dioxygenase-like cupin family protein